MATSGNNHEKVTYFAETDYRSKRIKFGIRDEDRARHMYVIGKTGMGKSTLLENLAIQDLQNGEGICFIDPHGGTAETLLSYVPEHRISRHRTTDSLSGARHGFAGPKTAVKIRMPRARR